MYVFSFYYIMVFCLFFLRSIRNYSCLLTTGQSLPPFPWKLHDEHFRLFISTFYFFKNKNTIVSWWNNSKKLITSFKEIISYLWRHLTKYALGGWINLIRTIGFKSETCLLHNRNWLEAGLSYFSRWENRPEKEE